MKKEWKERIEEAMGSSVENVSALSGGCVGEVYLGELRDRRRVVVKVEGGSKPALNIEGEMLLYLAEKSSLVVPRVYLSSGDLLVMEFLENDGRGGPLAEEEAADALAELHGVGADAYGFGKDTLIGGLPLWNRWEEDWARFFREERLLKMGRSCREAGKLDRKLWEELQEVAAGSEVLIGVPRTPGLIHGDIWSGNVLYHRGRLAGFIDPAIYYADPEVELAFITLFQTFGERFFSRYRERRGLEPGFFEVRRDLYNLFPLLVHVRLFGGSYVERLRSSVKGLLRELR